MKDLRQKREAFDRGIRSRIATNVTLVSALAILLAVFVNYGMSRLGEKKDLRFDMTASQHLALEDATRSFVRRIEDPVEVYLVYGIDDAMKQQARRTLQDRNFDTGYIDRYYRPRLMQMVQGFSLIMGEVVELNPKIRARLIDSEVERDEPVSLQRRLGVAPGQMLNHVVFYNRRTRARKLISLYHFFEVDLGGPDPTLGFRPPTIGGHNIESRIVIGLRAVMERVQKKVYVVTGQGERPLAGVTDTLRNDNFALKSLTLHREKVAIPTDCDLLLLFSPRRPWSPQTLAALRNYVESGGRVFITQGMDTSEPFTDLLERLGVTMLPVQVGHPAQHVAHKGMYYLYGSDLLTPSKGQPHPITDGTVREGLPVEWGFSHAYRLIQDYERDRVQRHVLVRSTANATAMPWIQDGRLWRQAPERGTRKGDFPLMLALELAHESGSKPGRVIVAGSDNWLEEGPLKRRIAAANMDLLMNSIYWLTDTEKLIMATPRRFRGALVNLEGGRAKSFMWLTVGLMPGLILLLGALIFFWRRHTP